MPDVTSFSRADAIATLRNSGFKVVVDVSDTADSTLDGVVMTQTPGPGESAKPGTTITITVGHFVAPTTTATAPVTTTEPVTTQEAPPPIAPTLPSNTTQPSP